jgi:hypothetical protein
LLLILLIWVFSVLILVRFSRGLPIIYFFKEPAFYFIDSLCGVFGLYFIDLHPYFYYLSVSSCFEYSLACSCFSRSLRCSFR